ncbi:MAG: GHKL domain-containing protein [Lachnospiraceae bacterium]|nr:GHKL domain-containing protein [Lachnospiraceae bacterium]
MSSAYYKIFDGMVSFLQGAMFVFYCNKFLGSRFSRNKSFFLGAVVSILLFVSITVQNYFITLSGFELLFYLSILIPYCFLTLEGKWYSKLIVPSIMYLLYGAITVTFHFLFSVFLDVGSQELMYSQSIYRVILIILINVVFVFIISIIVTKYHGNFLLYGANEVFLSIILPIITVSVIFLTLYISMDSRITKYSKIGLALIAFSVLIISVIIINMMVKISKSNGIKTENIIMKKEQELYKSEILSNNTYISEISSIKHDMKNKMLCICKMITDNKLEEALYLCGEEQRKIDNAPVIFTTENIYLNSILNVIYQKARLSNIDIKFTVKSYMTDVNGNDIITVIGNLCDNAIEYLAKNNGVNRKMFVSLNQRKNYYIITVKNYISGSVLECNPKLQTIKENVIKHGHGLRNVRNAIGVYGGTLDISEFDGMFIANVILEVPSTTE